MQEPIVIFLSGSICPRARLPAWDTADSLIPNVVTHTLCRFLPALSICPPPEAGKPLAD